MVPSDALLYDCDSSDLFEKLEDIDFFKPFIEYQYKHVSFSGARLRPIISLYNVSEAYGSYHKDIGELKRKENEDGPLELVKQAAFLSYWLRRVSPITGILGSTETLGSLTTRERLLAKYANEFCAFELAFRICRYVESRKEENVNKYVRTSTLDHDSDPVEKDVHEYMLCDIRSYLVDDDYIVDLCQCFKEKNVSPHSLYLMMKGLFMRLQP